MGTTIVLTCDMEDGCKEPITHIDEKGWIYCADHGRDRQSYQRCRKLRPSELKQLQRGEPLAKY